MVRSPTTCRDILYEVKRSAPNQQFIPEFALPLIQEVIAQMQPGERAIIYCGRKDTTQEVAETIRAPLYHSSSGSVDAKADILQK